MQAKKPTTTTPPPRPRETAAKTEGRTSRQQTRAAATAATPRPFDTGEANLFLLRPPRCQLGKKETDTYCTPEEKKHMQICRVCSRFVRVRRDIQNCRHLKGLPRRSTLRRPAGRRCPGRKLPLFGVVSFHKKRTCIQEEETSHTVWHRENPAQTPCQDWVAACPSSQVLKRSREPVATAV